MPVGRLDFMTEGLLLLTNDGELANRLQHPRYWIEKEYLAEVEGRPTERTAARLVRGVELDDGPASAVHATVKARAGDRAALRLVMVEGRKREVRRMLEAVGLPVRRLVRLRVRRGPRPVPLHADVGARPPRRSPERLAFRAMSAMEPPG